MVDNLSTGMNSVMLRRYSFLILGLTTYLDILTRCPAKWLKFICWEKPFGLDILLDMCSTKLWSQLAMCLTHYSRNAKWSDTNIDGLL